ncbi:MAG TPA: ATP-binding protein [Longimicrobiales bacterium]|nr:ATP-binding protein [Longimicrobiales bacterium]
MRSRVSIRLLLGLLVAGLAAPLSALSAWFAYETYRAETDRAESALLSLADAAATGVFQFLEDSRRIIEGLATDPDVMAMDPAACAPLFDLIGNTLAPLYSNVATWSREGDPVCSYLPTPAEGLDMSGTPGFMEGLATEEFFLTPVQVGRRSGRWSTALMSPIRDEAGARVGTVSLSVDLVRFQEILQGLNLPEDGLVSVTELDGTVVARSKDPERYVGSAPPAVDARSTDDPTFSRRGFSRALTFDNVPFSWGFVRTRGAPWIVYAGRPDTAVFASAQALRLRLILLGGTTLVGAALMGLAVYRRVARPLAALVEGVARSSADEPKPLPVDGPTEIALVAQKFNWAWSARLRAERDRERSDQRARSLVENAVMGIVVASETGRLLEVNQAAVELLGYGGREELLSTPVDDIYASAGEFARHRDENKGRSTFRGVSATWRKKDGSTLHVRLSGRRLTRGGEDGWEVFVEDVSEITRLQAQYLHAQKMEALGRLAGGVAHDFNNLLTVVQGQADLLRRDAALDLGQKGQADEIYHAAARGAALNRQLLAFGRRSPSDKTLLDLNEVVRGLELVMRRAAGEEIQLRLALASGVGPVRADRSGLEQILMNLVVNARDAMSATGTITLGTSVVTVTDAEAALHASASPGPHALLSVDDTGTGIPDDVLPHIFEPFYSTKPAFKGTGLGLATVYGIVADSGGHVRVQRKHDQGTVFEVLLPIVQAEQVDVPAPEGEAARPVRQGIILLVEDEDGVRHLAKQILERAGYEVLAAADGREALALAEGEDRTIDLVLTDVIMPGLRGPQVVEALAASGKVRRAVLFSGYPEGLSDAGPRGVAAWRFLAKPFTSRQLLDAIDGVLG